MMTTLAKNMSKSVGKRITTALLATSLLLSVSVQAAEKFDINALTAFMVEQTRQQVNQQLSEALNHEIEVSVMMKLPVKVDKNARAQRLLAKTDVKNKSKANHKASNNLTGE
jgi:hypothetical protein|tara:strand:+ start:129 stop:464 length:336 start_codon:yes stop_codon:yes gene_type:complete